MFEKIKKIVLATTIIASSIAFGCGQFAPKAYFNDYIYGINNFQVVSTVSTSGGGTSDLTTTYNIQNNQIVDFPLTVYVKLTSNTRLISDQPDTLKNTVKQAILQYRVLPNGKWVTVKKITKDYKTIGLNDPPMAYFGKNNIWPKGLARGTAVMIRYFTTDGTWQSGTLSDLCTQQLANRTISGIGTVYTLPNFNYTYTGGNAPQLGGSWTPSFCITVISSGKDRPLR